MKTLDSINNNERLYYIDWLRVLAFGLLFLFHAARFFDIYPWHVKNTAHSEIVNVLVGFTHGWRMHLIFFVSGAGTFFALRSRKGLFIKDRFKRLIVPFFFGVILLIPPQKFYEAISNGWFDGNALEFFLNYPSWLLINPPGVSLSWTGHVGYHIWYLAFLFIMTIVSLPLLKSLSRNNRVTTFLEYISTRSYAIFLFVIPIILFEIALRPIFPGYLDWADFFVYGVYFIAGYVFIIFRGFTETSRKHTYVFLNIGILITAFTAYGKSNLPGFDPENSIGYAIMWALLSTISTFSWVMFFLGLSQRKLSSNHRILPDLNAGILPFYILHQTVIILIGYHIISLDISILAKYTIILILSLLTTIGLYQVVRSCHVLRILFGMKSR